MRPVVLDQNANPSVRDSILYLMAHAQRADLAIATVRLGAIDLSNAPRGNGRYRLLLSEMDSSALHVVAGDESSRLRLMLLQAFAASGRLEVRCAGIARWCPDFSLYYGLNCPTQPDVALFGAHYFRALFAQGTALTTVLTEATQIRRIGQHFDSLWEDSYDVLPVISESLRTALDAVSYVATTGGTSHPAGMVQTR